MEGPAAVLVDGAGRLWVAEQVNNRVLRFDNAAALGNGTTANGVLGQPGFVTSGTRARLPWGSTSRMPSPSTPPAPSMSPTMGTIAWSTYKNPAAKANGAAADGVIGQPDFTTSTFCTTARTLHGPYGGLDFDAAGRLWVTDFINNRVLRFPGPTSATAPKVKGKVPKSVTTGESDDQRHGGGSTAASPRSATASAKELSRGRSGTTAWTFIGEAEARQEHDRDRGGGFGFGNVSAGDAGEGDAAVSSRLVRSDSLRGVPAAFRPQKAAGRLSFLGGDTLRRLQGASGINPLALEASGFRVFVP
jgi:hypothetical protein